MRMVSAPGANRGLAFQREGSMESFGVRNLSSGYL